MRLGLLQLNPLVGDLPGNAAAVEAAARQAFAQGADLCLTPELVLTGYPPRDLLLYGGFLARAEDELRQLAARLADVGPVIVGSVASTAASQGPGAEFPPGKGLYNAAFLLQGGQVSLAGRKSLLPTYDVFDESRYFEPWTGSKLLDVDLGGRVLRLAVTICEDVWNDKDFWPRRLYTCDPLAELSRDPGHCVRAIINLSASPFNVGKQRLREAMLGSLAAKHGVPLVYVNQCGGNDDLVFDGRSVVLDPRGHVAARLPGFQPAVAVVDLNALAPLPAAEAQPDSPEAEAWAALVCGTRDYVRKCGFAKVLLGLSGGVDSALTAAVAAQALGPDNVLGVLMPSPYSSQGSIDDSLALAELLGIKTLTVAIEPLMRAFDAALAPAFAGLGADTTEENVQSRIRGNLLMAMSNKHGAMLLTTGNKSELSVGYCTIYGDMSGGLAVISDVPKTMVYALSRYANRTFGPTIPEAVLTKAPSAELRPDQTDQDSLPPYDLLDAILHLHIEEHQTGQEIAARGYDPAVVAKVLRLVTIAEFKRRQAAPGLRITQRAFGTGWRMPIAAKRLL